jgi:hypothetical protein
MNLSPEMEHQKNHFLNYGFSSCPLSDEQLCELERRCVNHDFIYGIGCDVNAGVDFEVAVLLVHEIYGEESYAPGSHSFIDERD